MKIKTLEVDCRKRVCTFNQSVIFVALDIGILHSENISYCMNHQHSENAAKQIIQCLGTKKWIKFVAIQMRYGVGSFMIYLLPPFSLTPLFHVLSSIFLFPSFSLQHELFSKYVFVCTNLDFKNNVIKFIIMTFFLCLSRVNEAVVMVGLS